MKYPKQYSSLADFHREEIAPHMKAGWSFSDFYTECTPMRRQDDSLEYEEEEDAFDDFFAS